MKPKILATRIINIILISACLLIDIGFYINSHALRSLRLRYRHTNYDKWVNNLKPIDPPISQDLPYNKFIEAKTQQGIARSLKNGDYSHGSARLFEIVGTGTYDELCNTCTLKYPVAFLPKTQHVPYISLRGWKLKSTTSEVPSIDSVIYHVENGQPYIRKGVQGPEIGYARGNKIYKVQVEDIPVKFRYSHKSQMLKIPVSRDVKNTVDCITVILLIAVVAYSIFVYLMFIQLLITLVGGSSSNIWWRSILAFVLSPFSIIYFLIKVVLLLNNDVKTLNISDLAFTKDNIFRLQILAYSLTCFPILILLLNFSMRIIFSSYFIPDVVLNTQRLYPWLIMMHVGIVFLILLNVFRQGKALKDEQELTV